MRGRFFDQLKRVPCCDLDDGERGARRAGLRPAPTERQTTTAKRQLKQVPRGALDDGPTFTEKRGGWVRTRKAEQSRPIGPPEGGRYEC